jgi:zinc protease
MLPNGLKVIVTEDHTSPIAVFQIWYRVGSKDEEAGLTGMSHLLEHMMFKGTEKYGPGEISREVMRYGGADNAFTSKEYTAYFQILPSDRIDLSFEIESDRMRHLILDPQETLSERSVVMEERRLRHEDDPQNALFEQVVATAFNVHPYRWPVIGWMSNLANIEREDLLRHYRKYYSPDNAFIVVAGDVNTDEILEKAREHFATIEPTSSRRVLKSVEPAQQGERLVNLIKEAELPYLIAAYHVPSFPEKDGYALEILAHILSGKSGRLYRSVVYDEKIALNADAGYSGINTDPFLFFLDATAAPGEEVEDVEDALFEQVELLKEEPPTDFELQGAKNRLVASYIMGQDSVFNQAMQLGLYEILGDWRLLYKYVEEIHKVTAKDVSRVAGKYLTGENRTIGILIPEKAEEE